MKTMNWHLNCEKKKRKGLKVSIKFRLTAMSFLQFYVWGAWLITIGTYCIEGKGWSFPEFGAVFSTLAISSLFMPAIVGVRLVNFIWTWSGLKFIKKI